MSICTPPDTQHAEASFQIEYYISSDALYILVYLKFVDFYGMIIRAI